jgi:hypothetical protein
MYEGASGGIDDEARRSDRGWHRADRARGRRQRSECVQGQVVRHDRHGDRGVPANGLLDGDQRRLHASAHQDGRREVLRAEDERRAQRARQGKLVESAGGDVECEHETDPAGAQVAKLQLEASGVELD